MKIKKYIKKPIPVEAVQWLGNNGPDIFRFCGKHADIREGDYPHQPQYSLYIKTLEGRMFAPIGSYIIKGVAGEFYPCDKKIFESTYVEKTEDETCARCEEMTIDDAIRHCDEIVNDESTGPGCSKQHKQLADWLRELKSLQQKYQYSVADLDNLKKRFSKELELSVFNKLKDAALEFIKVFESVGAACGLVKNGNLENVSFAIPAIEAQVKQIMDSIGMEKIVVNPGDDFDYNIHNAVQTISSSDLETGKICSVFSNAWMLNGKLIKPANVVVVQ